MAGTEVFLNTEKDPLAGLEATPSREVTPRPAWQAAPQTGPGEDPLAGLESQIQTQPGANVAPTGGVSGTSTPPMGSLWDEFMDAVTGAAKAPLRAVFSAANALPTVDESTLLGKMQQAAPGWQTTQPTYINAYTKSLEEAGSGMGMLAGTGALALSRWLPRQAPDTLLGKMQSTGESMGAQLGEGLAKAPEEILKSMGQSWDPTQIGSNLKYRPMETISDIMVVPSLAKGLLRGAAKGTGILGAGATTKALNKAADIVSPSNLLWEGPKDLLKKTPVVGPTITSFEEALFSQRRMRGEQLRAKALEASNMAVREQAMKQVPPMEQQLMSQALEGTLPASQYKNLSPAAETYIEVERELNKRTEDFAAKTLARSSVPKLQAAAEALHKERFDIARFKPLAEELSQMTGMPVEAKEVRTMFNQGMLPWLGKEGPIYFPHKFPHKRPPERAMEPGRTLSPSGPGSLKIRKGAEGFETDVLKAFAEHERTLQPFLGKVNAIEDIIAKQGKPMLTDTQIELDAIKQATGIRHELTQALNEHINDAALNQQGLGLVWERPDQNIALQGRSVDRLLADMKPLNTAQRMAESANNLLFRNWVLAYAMGWNVSNLTGNTQMAVVSGRFNPFLAGRMRKGGAMPEELKTGLPAEAETLKAYHREEQAKMRLGEAPIGEWLKGIKQSFPGKLSEKATQALYAMNTNVDKFYREAAFASDVKAQAIREMREAGVGGLRLDPQLLESKIFDIAKDPVRAQKSIDFVNKMFGNYFDLTPFEQRVVRQVFPFWSWNKSMLKLAIAMPTTMPGRTEMLRTIGKAYASGQDDPLTPEDIKNGKVPFGVTKDGATVYVDFSNWSPYKSGFSGDLPPSTPLFAVLAAGLTGANVFGQMPTPPGYYESGGRLWQQPEKLGEAARPVPMSGQRRLAVQQAINQSFRVPLLKLLETAYRGQGARMQDPIFVTPDELQQMLEEEWSTSKQTPGEAAASFATGLGVREYKVPQLMEKHIERLQQATDKGYDKMMLKQMGEEYANRKRR